MQVEWKYCFESGVKAAQFLQALLMQREQGRFLGSTYPDGYCHSCFTKEQGDFVEGLASGVHDLNFERAIVFRGNLFAEDFGINTFAEPFVQWCPSPIYSRKFSQWIPPAEPWGTSMEGDLLFGIELLELIEDSIVGLEVSSERTVPGFVVCRPVFEVEVAHERSESEPLALNCSQMPLADVVRLKSGVILCSSRFARILSSKWKGSKYAKFQPVRCLNVPGPLTKRNLAKIPLPPVFDRKPIDDSLAVIESILNAELPAAYKAWVVDHRARLPGGWLSPSGGEESEIVQFARQEWSEADPAMPENLIPLYAFGEGDYICADVDGGNYVRWMHETGEYERVVDQDIHDLAKTMDPAETK